MIRANYGMLLIGVTFSTIIYADGTSPMSLTASGSATPGSTISVTATLTGKHLIYDQGCSLPAGNIAIYDNGKLLNSQEITSKMGKPNSEQTVYGLPGGSCWQGSTPVAVLATGPTSTLLYNYTLPNYTPRAHNITAVFTGDSFITQTTSSTFVIQQSPDVYQIVTHNTGTHTTEVHILDAKTNYTTYKIHTGTALEEVSPNDWSFAIGDYNGDGIPDLYAIDKNNTGSGRTEVHILNGADNFQSFLLHTPINIEESTGDEYEFDLADHNGDNRLDLYAIKRANTGTNSTEVHVLDGSTNFQTSLLDTGTPLAQTGTDDSWEFHVGDYNHDGHPDVYGILKTAGTGTTELHVLDGATNYQTWALQTTTGFGPTGSNSQWVFGLDDFNADGKIDFYGINKTEPSIHAVDGNNPQNFLLHQALPTGNVGTDHSVAFLLPR